MVGMCKEHKLLMRKLKTHFEQIPVKVVMGIAHQEEKETAADPDTAKIRANQKLKSFGAESNSLCRTRVNSNRRLSNAR